MIYRFRQFYIPERMMEAIQRYVIDGCPPGDFLAAVLHNDLKDACAQADDENLANLPAFVAWFYNEAPAASWGSRAVVENWLAMKAAIREASK